MSILNNILLQIFRLPEFKYNKEIINSKYIYAFKSATKNCNDKNNKMRENIVGAILNNKVPADYYIIKAWNHIKKQVFTYIQTLDDKPYTKIECLHKGGRKYNYDFNIVFHDTTPRKYNIELKFNASTIDDAPQFVSPMKPSQYMSQSYENYYYAHYLPQLSEKTGFPLPSLAEYVSQIHGNKPSCMKLYQDLYYCGCSQSSKFTNNATDIEFYEFAKSVSNESITKFIQETDLNIEMMTDYLQNTQKDKIYMLYNGVRFILQHVNMDDYKIESVVKNPEKFRYECVTKSGKKMNILLRWKNGNGIAFPAFQIS